MARLSEQKGKPTFQVTRLLPWVLQKLLIQLQSGFLDYQIKAFLLHFTVAHLTPIWRECRVRKHWHFPPHDSSKTHSVPACQDIHPCSSYFPHDSIFYNLPFPSPASSLLYLTLGSHSRHLPRLWCSPKPTLVQTELEDLVKHLSLFPQTTRPLGFLSRSGLSLPGVKDFQVELPRSPAR